MTGENQTKPETTHARIRKDHKKRVRKIALTETLNGNETTGLDVLSEILDRELPKRERKLGIK
jgi:hypothetical protein